MTRWDAVIVGGGPGGSACAWRLTAAGLRVLVVDRARFPRDKPCAGWITPGVLSVLKLRPEDLVDQGLVVQPITGFRTSLLGSAPVDTAYEEPVSYGIRRWEFDAFLLDRSRARVMTGTSVAALVRDANGWIVNHEFATPLLIGAGGHFCPVARHVNPARPNGASPPVVAAQEIEIELQEDADAVPAVPEFYFCPDLLGYGWVFRKGRFLNVGFGRQDVHSFPEHTGRFQDFLSHRRDLPPPAFRGWKGHAYLLAPDGRVAVDEGLLLVGDAAGLADPRSGEGIRTAVESGLLAAEVALAAEGRYTRARLAPYADELKARFGYRRASAIRRLAPARVARALAPMLMQSRWFVRHVVLDRWFLRRGTG